MRILWLTIACISVAGAKPVAGTTESLQVRHSVVVDSQAQIAAGIKTQIVHQEDYVNELVTLGKVVSIEPLLASRSRYQVAQAELKSAEAKLKQTGQNLKRQRDLFRDGIGALRVLQELNAQLEVDQSRVEASRAQMEAIANEAKLNWGDTLTRWIFVDSPVKLKALLSGRQHVLQITVPFNLGSGVSLHDIPVSESSQRVSAKPAQFISRAPQMDPSVQGVNYFFISADPDLQIGMKVTAWLPQSNLSQSGMLVPESALVWYMDQMLVYVKSGNEEFRRQPIVSSIRAEDGYLVQEGLKEGDEIVIAGGQTLLSEDLRQQIPEED